MTLTSPKRAYDSRQDERIAAGEMREIPLGAFAPTDATAVVVNVTVADPAAPGYVTAVACGVDVPATSTVNYLEGQTVANSAIIAVTDRRICVYSHAETDVIVDVTGWLTPGATRGYAPIDAVRVADTRTSGRLAAQHVEMIDVAGVLPSGASGLALNVTVTGPDEPGHLTVWGCEGDRPGTSNLNHTAGDTRAASAFVYTTGQVCVYSHAETDVVVDVVGAIIDGGARYLPAPATRLVDTRDTGELGGGTPTEFAVAGISRDDIVALAANVTVVDHDAPGFARLWRCGEQPSTSNVNQLVGQPAANAAILALSDRDTICSYLSATGHLIVDTNGWWITGR